MIIVLQNNPDAKSLLESFTEKMGSSRETFRYFSTRSFDVIDTHIYTILVIDEKGSPIGYGHLDPAEDIIWLGICVSEAATGKGVGNIIMNDLLNKAGELNIPEITLKVDSQNQRAVTLYKKFNFEIVSGGGEYFIMKYSVAS
ncbi:GNAT family N-acetyltransferase [Sediminibacterium ginsengisoli]|uniref:Acetyltransferase (GNAT) family protein n=1 Tax=Sediminibacterium ginsengisoli TaxID=413434 RepID=A0A1T4N4Y9_9BACT|nr:GNAT family N-acetyltransferase [Sediminibacterium ginsengisoli]SJZ74313.1 Acetyltransferase (GNAT) family protein [Sediminibacterium ginsengisoli]